MEKKSEIYCPHCASTDIKKHGKNNGVQQRYYCKECKRTFILESDKKRHWYTSKEKAFISMLLSFIEPVNDSNIDIHKIVNNLNESKTDINKISIEQKAINGKELQCFQPKILICKDDNDIKIYRFNVRHTRFVKHREITLIDDNKNSKKYKK